MLVTLEDDQTSDWKTYAPSLVHAYNSTGHESTGYLPHFLIIGRHPRLAVDAFLGIKLGSERSDKSRCETDFSLAMFSVCNDGQEEESDAMSDSSPVPLKGKQLPLY